MARRRTLPQVSPKVTAELRPMVAAIKEIIEIGEGVRGDPLDRKLTLRDLVDSGIGRLRAGALAGSPNALEPNPAPPNLATPPKPGSFNVTGGFNGRIDLTWTIPGSLYGNHAYTNVYRAETDNFANATLVGREAGSFYTDVVRDDATIKTYYYWITFTSTSDIEGPVNATAGTPGAAIVDVKYLLETLTNNLDDAPATLGAPDETLILHADRFALRTGPTDSPTYPMVVASVNGTPTVVLDTAIIRDGSIQEGQIGALTFGKIEAADGTPITTVGGLLKADYIDVDNLSVAEAATFYGDAQSGSFATDIAGWKLWQIGDFEAYNATVRGHIEATSGYIASTLQIGGTPRTVGEVRDLAESATRNVYVGEYDGATAYIKGDIVFYLGNGWIATQPTTGNAPPSTSAGSSAYWELHTIKGDEGPQGVPGEDGANGQATYTWIRYADTATGSGISNDPTGKEYIGLAYNKLTPTESNTASDYTWSLIKGTDGVQGPAGEDGQTLYTWIAYSDNSDGSGMYQTPAASTEYIGIAVNKTTATESTSPADYTWSKFRGDQGSPGADGSDGASSGVVYRAGTSVTQPSNGTAYPPAGWSVTPPTTSDPIWECIGTADAAGYWSWTPPRVSPDYWKKPGETTIDGNKIFTGDAYVDTLQIQGQAVTFPRGVYTGGSIDAFSSWVTVQSLTLFGATGAPIIVTFCCGVTSAESGSAGADIRLLVGGSQVYYAENVTPRYTSSIESQTNAPNYRLNGMLNLTRYYSSPGTGNVSVVVQMRSATFTAATSYGRSLAVIEAKR